MVVLKCLRLWRLFERERQDNSTCAVYYLDNSDFRSVSEPNSVIMSALSMAFLSF